MEGSPDSPGSASNQDLLAAAPDGRFTATQRLLITLAAIGITLVALRTAASVITPVLLALVITMAVAPFLHWLIKRGLPPWVAWLVTVVLTVAAVVFLFTLVGVGVVHLIAKLQSSIVDLQARFGALSSALDGIGIHTSGLIRGDEALLSSDRLVRASIALLQVVRRLVSNIVLTLVIVFFMLAEATTLEIKFSMTPPQVSPTLQRLQLFTSDMRAFVQATAEIGLINGIAVGVVIWLLGVDYPVLWGVLAFFMSFIPSIGFIFAVLPPAFLALATDGWQTAVLVLISFVVIWAVTGSLRSGRFVGRRLNLSPLVILLSVVLWGWVFGLMGGLLAVPMTLLVRRLLVEASDESRWITDLLGRVGPAPAAGERPAPAAQP